MIGSTFMIGSSKWNKEQSPDDCIFRLCERLDYTRCEERDAIKVCNLGSSVAFEILCACLTRDMCDARNVLLNADLRFGL